MDPGIVHSVFRALRQDEHAFLFSARFHDEHTARLIALGEAMFAGRAGGSNKGRIAFLMVEAYQNVIRHRAPMLPALEAAQGRSMFMFRWPPSGPEVITANPVMRENVTGLESSIARLRGADAGELKRMFLSGLRQEHDGSRRGAGLGLIEMARRSGSDPGHSLRGLGDDRSLFVLSIRVGNGRSHDGSLADAAVFHGTTVQNDLLLLYTGHDGPGINTSLLQMLENDVVTEADHGRRIGRAFLAGTAWLGGHAADGGRSIMVAASEGAHVALGLGKVLSLSDADRMAKQVEAVNALDRSEVDRRYRRSLVHHGSEGESPDLYDLARISVEPLVCGVFPSEEGGLLVVRAII